MVLCLLAFAHNERARTKSQESRTKNQRVVNLCNLWIGRGTSTACVQPTAKQNLYPFSPRIVKPYLYYLDCRMEIKNHPAKRGMKAEGWADHVEQRGAGGNFDAGEVTELAELTAVI